MPTFLHTLAAGAPTIRPLEHVVDHPIWASKSGDWWYLTNHMVLMLISAGLMLLIFPRITKPYRDGKHVPTGTHNFFEAMLVYVRDDVARPVLGDLAGKFLPFLWTMFFFILFMNLLGLLPLDVLTAPIAHAVGLEHGIYGTPTANPYVTGVLAVITFFVIQISGIRANGVGNYLKHFLAGAPLYMAPIIVIIEIMGIFIKPFALFIRLVANMMAGHVLVAVLISFTALAYAGLGLAGAAGVGVLVVAASVATMCLEVFVAFLQAYIFTFLTALFIGQLVVHEHEHKEGEGGVHDERHELIGSSDLTDYSEYPDGIRQVGAHMAG